MSNACTPKGAPFLVATLLLIYLSSAPAAERVALVIGNGKYQHAPLLPNPGNDAVDVSTALENVGFSVIRVLDADKRGLERSLRRFREALSGARVGLFYYSGHALQVRGENYLAPVDAALTKEADLDFEAVPLSFVLKQMEHEPRTNLVFLDACRDNPLARSLARSMGATRSTSVGQGLTRVGTGIGTFIAYATQPDNVALDGTGRNSPFTAAMLEYIYRPGLEIRQLLTRVRNHVRKVTDNQQTPWDASSLTQDFYFVSGPAPTAGGSPGPDAAAANDWEPAMVRLRGGGFTLGSPPDEPGRETDEAQRYTRTGDFWIGKYEITVDEFSRFVVATGYRTEAERGTGCRSFSAGAWRADERRSWRSPGFPQTGKHPVVCVSWNDASAYSHWLNQRTGKQYRLPTEAEWEYAARAATKGSRHWGDDTNLACQFANAADQSAKRVWKAPWEIHTCDDGAAYTVPADSIDYRPNGFGLYHMLGNVSEWTCSRYQKIYAGAEMRCDIARSGRRVARGGAWYSLARDVRAASRSWFETETSNSYIGFRIARSD